MPIRTVSGSTTSPVSVHDVEAARRRVAEGDQAARRRAMTGLPDAVRQIHDNDEAAQAARRKVFAGLPPGVRQNPEVRKKFGLGDAVEVIARPFARLLGKTNCASCKKRQELLNQKLPSLNPFRLGQK